MGKTSSGLIWWFQHSSITRLFEKITPPVFIFPLMLALFSFSGTFTNNPWEFAGWYGGGYYPNIEYDRKFKGRVYLTSDVSGILRSDDLGEHWYFINQGLANLYVAAVTVAPSDSNVLYAATSGGIYVSHNAGTSWMPAQNPEGQIKFVRPNSYKPIAVSPLDPLRVCIATSLGTVYCSADAGQNWQVLSKTPNVILTNILFNRDATKIYVGGAAGFRFYNFTTGLWSGLYATLCDLTDLWLSTKNSQKLYAAANGELWYSNNEGRYWTKQPGIHSGKIYRLILLEQVPTRIFAAVNLTWSGKVIVSEDNGLTWQDIVTTVTADVSANPTWGWKEANGKIISLKVNPYDTKMMSRGSDWGLFRTNDSGANWFEKIKGAPNTVGSDIKFINNELFVATMDNGLLKSSDGGLNYQAVFPFDKTQASLAGHVWRVISPAPAENKIVATISPWNEKVNQVLVSDDGGKTFAVVRSGLPLTRPRVNTMWGEGYPRALAFDPSDPKRIYLGIDGDDGGGLFVSDDGGMNWTRSVGQPGALRIYNALAVDPTNPQRIFWGAGGTGGGVWVSEDRGNSWSQVLNTMSWVFDLLVTSNGTVFAAGDAGGATVFMSSDHGITWTKVAALTTKGSAEALAVDPLNPNRIAVSAVLWSPGAAGKIFLSQDNGLTWNEVTGDLPPGAGAAAMTFSPDGQYLYVSRYAGSVYRLKVN